VLQDDELTLQLDRDLDDRGEDDDERPVPLAGADPGVERLDDLDGVQEPVEVPEHQDRRAVGGRRPAEGAERRERVGGGAGRPFVARAGPAQPAVDVPDRQAPALPAAEAGDLDDRVVVLEGLDVDAAERGAHQLLQTLG
jgi:hypothetical protein